MAGYGRTAFATEIYTTPQKGPRIPDGPIGFIIIHHAATESFEAVIRLEMGLRQVSSTDIVKDVRVASMMDESSRAWSVSSQYWDSVSVCVETCNSGGASEGWPISEASYATLAKMVAEWCKKYGIPCNRTYIMGHRELWTRYGASYPTACPGGIDVDRVVRDANAILTPSKGTPVMYRSKINGTKDIAYFDGQQYFRCAADSADDLAWIRFTGIGNPNGISETEAAIYKKRADDFIASVKTPLTPAQIEALAAAITKDLPAGATKAEVDTIVRTRLNALVLTTTDQL